MDALDILVFFLYMAGITIFGASFFRKNRSPEAFTTGSQSLPSWVIGMSIFATFVSSISYLALPGNAYASNWNAFVFSLSIPLAAWIAIRFFIPLYRRVGSPSAYTYLEERFGPWARIYVSACYVLTQLMRVGTILYLLALALNAMLGWPIPTIILITGIAVLVYSTLGGIQAVVWTDALQGLILIGGALFCALFLLFDLPEGPSQLFRIASENHKFSLGSFSLALNEPTFWVVLIYGLFINLQNFGIDQNYVQRYMAARTDREAKRSAFLGGMLYIPVSALFLFIGTALFAYYGSAAAELPAELREAGAADRVFPYFISTQLPAGLTGLMIASIFAAGMSTVSTSFNSVSTVILTDYYRRFFQKDPSGKASMRVLYLSSLILCLLGMGIGIAMINVKSALDAWWTLASIFSGGMLGLFLLGAFTPRRNPVAAMVGVLVGVVLILLISLPDWMGGAENRIFHPYLTIVLGTTAILITGFLAGLIITRRS